MEFPKDNIINDWLQENGNPEIAKLVEKNLAIANKIHKMLEDRGLNATDLARMLKKTPSEISKWLTGTYPFTTKTITKIETILGDEIINFEPQREIFYLKIYVNHEEKIEETSFETSEVFAIEGDFVLC